MARTKVAGAKRRSQEPSPYITFLAALIVILGIGAFFFRVPVMQKATDVRQNIAFAINPSAAQAYEYGREHFDTASAGSYDLHRAQSWFEKALSLDPALPYVHHELARIAFLEGDYQRAMLQINVQILQEGTSTPNSYYVRGLIEGYMGDYVDAAKDYTYFIQFDPHDWAAKNDDAWVLLKAGLNADALKVANAGLADDPSNPWLLNSKSIALYELGRYPEALSAAQAATAAVQTLTPREWSHAYPGNDPAIAPEGLNQLQSSIAANLTMIEAKLSKASQE